MELVKKLKILRHNIYRWMFNHMPIQENKVILWADSFKHYGCSPKYIAKYIITQCANKFDLVWVFDQVSDIPEDMPVEIRIVRYFSIDYLKEIATAKFIICNARTGKAHYFDKRDGQVYIQTWHSSLRLKKIEGDISEGQLPQEYITSAKEDSQKIDLLVSGCEFSSQIFRRAFWYDGELLECGTPRCDVLLNDTLEIRKKVFRYYGISEKKRLALYAPTFRNDKKASVYGLDFDVLRKVLNNDEWEIGFRLHPNIHEELDYERCISMTHYSDMQELIAAADLLITDYSSCMFDMAIANKPCVLYVPDLEDYCKNERGLYFDIMNLPFPISRSMDELCDQISHFNKKKYLDDVRVFINEIGSFEKGTAAKQIVDYMLRKMS